MGAKVVFALEVRQGNLPQTSRFSNLYKVKVKIQVSRRSKVMKAKVLIVVKQRNLLETSNLIKVKVNFEVNGR